MGTELLNIPNIDFHFHRLRWTFFVPFTPSRSFILLGLRCDRLDLTHAWLIPRSSSDMWGWGVQGYNDLDMKRLESSICTSHVGIEIPLSDEHASCFVKRLELLGSSHRYVSISFSYNKLRASPWINKRKTNTDKEQSNTINRSTASFQPSHFVGANVVQLLLRSVASFDEAVDAWVVLTSFRRTSRSPPLCFDNPGQHRLDQSWSI